MRRPVEQLERASQQYQQEYCSEQSEGSEELVQMDAARMTMNPNAGVKMEAAARTPQPAMDWQLQETMREMQQLRATVEKLTRENRRMDEEMRQLRAEAMQLSPSHATSQGSHAPTHTGSKASTHYSTARSIGMPVTRPTMFNGENAREWFVRAEKYYYLIGADESYMLDDVVNLLEGAAFTHYCAMKSAGRLPTTWEGFKRMMMERFAPVGVGETMRRLRALKWEGSLDLLAEKFSAILAKGVEPPQYELTWMFLNLVPEEMAFLLESCGGEPRSWIEAKEKMKTAAAWRERVRDMRGFGLRSGHGAPIREEKTRDSYNDHNRTREGGVGTVKVREYIPLIAERRPLPPSAQSYKCHSCQGVGHSARECPSQREATRKEGQTCANCKGTGHWARDCATRPASSTRPWRTVTQTEADWQRARNESRSTRPHKTEQGNAKA